MSIFVTRSSMPDFDEYCAEISSLWESHILTNMGEKHCIFEKMLADKLETPYITLFANGHTALENAIAAFQFPIGSEIITTPFTFASTTNAIIRCGMKPVFCDISLPYYTLDPSKIEELITERTVAILPVHVYGNVCDMESIEQIAEKHSLKVIYDAAHAFGATYRDKSIAQFGDITMFSFHATKVFHTIEGGAVCYHDENLKPILDGLKNFGIVDDEIIYPGGNAKMNEFQAAMGICNLRHIDENIKRRQAISERYLKKLDGIPGLTLCPVQEHVSSNYAYFPVLFDGFRSGTQNRDTVAQRLASCDIYSRKYFYPLTNSADFCSTYKNAGVQNTPTASYVSSHILTLPLYPELPLEDVDRICKIITNE